MDNFMDKLAERYNAQDMIKANSGAEQAHMKSLEDQVEAYEAVLQEMRKLNYRNSELTEKMYALVDESMEKVKTLQIEAASGGVDAEAVRLEMSEEVSRAIGTALGNMDESMMKSLSESLKGIIEQPAEELRQTSAAVQTSADDIKASSGELKETVDGMREDIKSVRSSSDVIMIGVDGIQASMNEVIQKIDAINAIAEKGSNEAAASESTAVLSPETLTKIDKLDTIEEIGGDMKAAMVELYDAITKARDSISELRKNQDILIGDQSGIKSNLNEVIEKNTREINRVSAKLDDSISAIKDEIRTAAEASAQKAAEEEAEKEAEETPEEEDDKLEERFKANEEFMHKEGVKVYRNVQAVINEKSDKSASDIEAHVKKLSSKIGRAHAAAIFAFLFSLINLVVTVLRILAII
ncbi:MAG: hypothetical protein J6Z42_00645 [Lachnospiraceae bacterium]|jgi:chromosome segregation ATPase|nr:hypothetical protein [Lachnospiraceae bacterium]